MFWKFNLSTRIDTLLEKDDVSFQEVMDEDDVLQECKAQNKKLVEFLTKPEHIEELVNLVTQEPDEDKDDKVKYKYPNTACELLTSDVPQITDMLANDDALLNKVYSFLESEGPLNPLQASFFGKVMGLLITRKSELMVNFLQSKDDFVGHLLHHMGVSAIMDLLLRLITCIESPECRNACIAWLNEQKIIQKLIDLIDPKHSEEKRCNAASWLCDMLMLSREQMSQLQENADPDPLLSTIESEDTIGDLLSHMFDGEKEESVVVSGLQILQTLLEFRKIGPEGCQEQMTPLDAERLGHGVRNTLAAVIPRIKDFHQLLLEPPKQHFLPMPTTIGNLETPLGNARLQTCRLIASLLLTNTHAVNRELAKYETIGVIMDLYFKFLWNNFLHTQVELCIATILSNSPTESEDGTQEHPLLDQLFNSVKITKQVLDAWEDNEQQQSRPAGRRRGYMGHLTRLANHTEESKSKGINADRIKNIFQDFTEDDREKWDKFVSETLAEANKQNTIELIGTHLKSSSEDDDDFRNIPFPQDTAMQQAFSDYQLQQMTSNFIDQFGFNEEEFTEQEESVDAPFTNRISSINFDINVEDNPRAATLFEQACNERMQQFDDQDADAEDDMWETKEITFAQAPSSHLSSTKSGKASSTQDNSDDDVGSDDSTDSEEDLNSPRRIYQSPASTTPNITPTTTAFTAPAEKMEVDSSDADDWADFNSAPVVEGSQQNTVDMETNASPWDAEATATTEPQSTEGDDWANFDSISETATSTSKFEAQSASDNASMDNFADFSQISTTMNTTAPEMRSSIDVEDMEASESTSSRGNAYLVDSAPADLASQVEEAASSAQSSNEATATSQSSPPDCPRLAWSSVDEASPVPTSSAAVVSASSSGCSEESVADSSSPTSTPHPVIHSADCAISSSSDMISVPEEDDSTRQASGSSQEAEVSSCSERLALKQGDDIEGDEDDDLGANFNFLASSGLLRSSDGREEDQPQGDEVSSSGDNNGSKVDDMRAQAQEALEQFASATNKTDSVQNGPV